MKIVTLVENSTGHEGCIAEHGLCLYVETVSHKLLLDTGQTEALLHNADVLGIDLSAVDTAVLSHGHYDHAGGILPFLSRNSSACIYMQRTAAEEHYHGERYIGIDPAIPNLPQTVLLDGDLRIDEELSLFTGITGRRLFSRGNAVLRVRRGGEAVCDDFRHEQCLVIAEGEKRVLLSGCAHNGVLNILDTYYARYGALPDAVLTGFHMMQREGVCTAEALADIRETARVLAQMPTVFYSGHCTGDIAFSEMQQIMGDRLRALHTGIAADLQWIADLEEETTWKSIP